jgi:hypothetical protein
MVADTGSNVMVVPGKECQECVEAKKNVYDNAKSTTSRAAGKTSTIRYGSGPVVGDIFYDTVEAIGVSSEQQSVLSMTEEHIKAYPKFSFDGIMGMGMPTNAFSSKDTIAGVDATFLAKAGADSFTMCFDKGPRPDGVLKLGSKKNATFVFAPVVGQVHWGVKMNQASLEGKPIPDVCDGDGCAVIVDSGTTLMMAPPVHLISIYASLCDHLPGCNARSQGAPAKVKATVFQEVLLTCPKEMDLLPDIKLQLGPAVISLPRTIYIMKSKTEEMENFVGGLGEPLDLSSVSSESTVCVPSFMHMNLVSANHGPIWILGMPLMREYTVMFDRQGPSVGFSKTVTCKGCNSGETVQSGEALEQNSADDDVLVEEELHTYFSPSTLAIANVNLLEDGSVGL